jgi:hypothetical protein
VSAAACLAAGGGCGVGVGLGWGQGAAFGSKYIVIEPEFETKKRRPQWLTQLQNHIAGHAAAEPSSKQAR